MSSLAAISSGFAGALAGVPVAAIAYAVPAHGRVRVPERWWAGGPARPAAVATTALLAGAAAAVVGAVLPSSLALLAFWAFAVLGAGLAIIDARRRRLPHCFTGALWASCTACFVATATISGDVVPLLRALTTGGAATAVLLVIALAMPGQLGLGDVAFAGAIALNLGWLGWPTAVVGLLTGLVLQGVISLVAAPPRGSNDMMPMGPALTAGWLLAVMFAA